MDRQDGITEGMSGLALNGSQPLATYDADVVAWSREQAALLRAGRFADLDIEHLADEIADVGRSEERELANRMAVLLIHLLKWQLQPERRGASWQITLRNQRHRIHRRMQKMPSLAPLLTDPEWLAETWDDAMRDFERETGLRDYPLACPWTMTEILADEWLPADPNNA